MVPWLLHKFCVCMRPYYNVLSVKLEEHQRNDFGRNDLLEVIKLIL